MTRTASILIPFAMLLGACGDVADLGIEQSDAGQSSSSSSSPPTKCTPSCFSSSSSTSSSDACTGSGCGSSSTSSSTSSSSSSFPISPPLFLYQYGGTLDGTISENDSTFDGSGWSGPTSNAMPPARSSAAMASMTGDRAVLFGGAGADNATLGDTWLFEVVPGTWTTIPVTSTPLPPARFYAGMAPLGTGVVLFGGYSDAEAPLGDTWSFDGLQWTQVDVSGPGARYGFAMSALPGDNAVVIFGGYAVSPNPGPEVLLADTWAFDGTTWTEVTGPGPSARSGAAMASFGSGVVLFGGQDATGALGDTWTFDGTHWASVPQSQGPSARHLHAMSTLFGGEAVMLGGIAEGSTGLADTWIFQNGGWTQAEDYPEGGIYGATLVQL